MYPPLEREHRQPAGVPDVPDPARDNYELALALRELADLKARLEALGERHRLLLEGSAEGQVVLDGHGRILEHNTAALESFGGDLEALQRWLWGASGAIAGGGFHPAIATLLDGKPRTNLEVVVADRDGRRRWFEVSALAVPHRAAGRATAVVCRFADVTTRRLRERRLESQASVDPLTGAFNRRYLEHRLSAEMSRARRSGRALSLAVGDLDHFKRVNDRYGHAAGDLALRAFASTLRETLRTEDVVTRLGGDEFCVLLPDTGAEQAVVALERVLARLRATRIDCGGRQFGISGTFGAAVCAPGLDAAGLIARADAALYRAKALGRGRVVLLN